MGFRLSITILALAATAVVARAQTPEEFYRGRTVTLLVGSGVGGGYDAYSRTLARHWGRHIPGSPGFVVQNMPGANGVTMMNNLANAAAKDGSVIGAAFAANVIEPVIDGGKFTKFDSRELNWIGNIAPQYNGCFVRRDSAIKTLEDAMKRETLMSATGANSNSAVMANVYNAVIGTKFKVIAGYSTAEQTLAIERKEVEGTCLSFDTLLTTQPAWIERDLANWLIVLNDRSVPEMSGAPPATQFARSEQDRQMIMLLIARNILGRPYVVAKEAPADRVAALRASFMATMKDPEYLAETKKLRMTVSPMDHAAMEKMIAEVYATPAAVVQKALQLTK